MIFHQKAYFIGTNPLKQNISMGLCSRDAACHEELLYVSVNLFWAQVLRYLLFEFGPWEHVGLTVNIGAG